MKLNPFETRIEILNKSRDTPSQEIDTAILIYERLRTARAACATEFGDPPPVEAVLAVFSELCQTTPIAVGSRRISRKK